MKFRWTMKQMETMTDAQILRGLVAERQSDLNPYTPFATRLQAIYNALDKQIEAEREAEKKTYLEEATDTLHYLETILSEESEENWQMELGRIRMTLANIEGGTKMPNTKSQMGPKTERTPGPWEIWQHSTENNPQVVIAEKNGASLIAQTVGQNDEANAAFIVKACNHFEEMKTVITRMMVGINKEDTEDCEWYEGIEGDAADEAKDLLSEIKGGE